MRELIEKFLKDNSYQANEHGVYIYKSQDGSDSVDIEAMLELFGQELRDKIHKSIN